MTAILISQMVPLQTTSVGKAIVDTLVKQSDVYNRLSFQAAMGMNEVHPYLSNIPTPGLRHINEAGAENTADWAQISYALSIMESTVKIDPVANMVPNQSQNVFRANVDAITKAFAFQTVNLFVNGDITNDLREPEGMLRRLTVDPRFVGQTVNATANSTELNLAVGTAADADYRIMFHKINQALAVTDLTGGLEKGGPAYFLSNWNAQLTLEAAAKQLRIYDVNKDQYNREFQSYKGLDILNAGWKPVGAVTGAYPAGGVAGDLIIGNDSYAPVTTNGALGYDKTTPFMVVRTGDNYVHGLQLGNIDTKDRGEDNSGSPFYRKYSIRHVFNPFTPMQKRAMSVVFGFNFSGTTS